MCQVHGQVSLQGPCQQLNLCMFDFEPRGDSYLNNINSPLMMQPIAHLLLSQRRMAVMGRRL